MKHESIFKISYQQYQHIINSDSLKENILSDFFRNNKFIGSKERKIIQEITFALIRHHLTVQNFTEIYSKFNTHIYKGIIALIISEYFYSNSAKNVILAAVKLYNYEKNFEFLYELFCYNLKIDPVIIINYLKRYLDSNAKDFNKNIELNYSFPKNISNLLENNAEKELSLIAESYLKKNHFTIRANLIITNSKEIELFLEESDIPYKKSDILEDAFIIEERKSLQNSSFYKNGYFEIQDEASMLVANALNADSNDKVLDACAGAGGKSLHLASITNNDCEIFAYDINQNKLNELKKRRKRNNAGSIKIIDKTQIEKNQFDYILIDAPCSGSGTLRRNPALKYKISDAMIRKYHSLQLNILNYYSRFLKTGGKLVYSTCSIIPMENEEVISKFLINNKNFSPYPLPEKYFSNFKKFNNSGSVLILPYEFNSDGFYICKLIKSK